MMGRLGGSLSLSLCLWTLVTAIYSPDDRFQPGCKGPFNQEFFPSFSKEVEGAPFVCPAGWTVYNNLCIKAFDVQFNYAEAKKACRNMGAILVEFHTIPESCVIESIVVSSNITIQDYWIGIEGEQGINKNETWVSSGSAYEIGFDLPMWAPFQPTMEGKRQCAASLHDETLIKKLSMYDCTSKKPFVCQLSACLEGQFFCGDIGSKYPCIHDSSVCDGVNDCGNWLDEEDCAGKYDRFQFTADMGNIKSIGYDNGAYEALKTIYYTVVGDLTSKLTIEFLDISTEPDIDTIEVWVCGRIFDESIHVATYSGRSIFPLTLSPNNYFKIIFSTDGSVEKKGFNLEWYDVTKCKYDTKVFVEGDVSPSHEPNIAPYTLTDTADNCMGTCKANTTCFSFVYKNGQCTFFSEYVPFIACKTAGCAKIYAKKCPGGAYNETLPQPVDTQLGGKKLASTDKLDYISSLFYPNQSPVNTLFSWVICTAGDFGTVSLEVLDVDLKEENDQLVIINGDEEDGQILYKIKGGDKVPRTVNGDLMSLTFMTSSRCAMVKYQSYSIHPARGFLLTYRGDSSVNIKAGRGMIQTSACSNDLFLQTSVYTWTIKHTGPLLLTFEKSCKFDISERDIITINNGTTDFIFNNRTKPDPVVSDTGYLKVVLNSKTSNLFKGFTAEFSTDCMVPSVDLGELRYGAINGPLVASKSYHIYTDKFTVYCPPGHEFVQVLPNKTCASRIVPSFDLECGFDGKWNTDLFPQCKKVFCGAAPNIEYGLIESVSGNFEFGGNITYSCQAGSTLFPHPKGPATCDENAAWVRLPSCSLNSCPKPMMPMYGSMTGVAGNITYQTVVSFECNTGYQLIGDPIIYCMSSGNWSGPSQPMCVPQPCLLPLIGQAYNNVTNINGTGDKYIPVAESAEISCKPFFELNGNNIITCNDNRTFEMLPNCTDIDECSKTFSCMNNSHCVNTLMGYKCDCDKGYQRYNGSCVDINECDRDPNLCKNGVCVNKPGSYECTCCDGYVLWTSNSTGNVYTAPTETGYEDWNIVRINHTCVPATCSLKSGFFQNFANGTLMKSGDDFFYYDTMDLLCDLGYVIAVNSVRTTNAFMQFRCENNTMFSPVQPTDVTCEPALCSPLDLTGLVNPPVVTPSGVNVSYSENVTMMCNVTGLKQPVFERRRQCLYDFKSKTYKLHGDQLECGEIDCGIPKYVSGVEAVVLDPVNSTKYGAFFNYSCKFGFTQNGASAMFNNSIVTCMSNGKWDYGDLECQGPKCTDPGHPIDGTQTSEGFEAGQAVTFACNRDGYIPVNPGTGSTLNRITCFVNGSGAFWDGPTPECSDRTPPVFNMPVVIAYDKYAILDLTTNVSDNDAVKEVTFSPSAATVGFPVVSAVNITYTAKDYANNIKTHMVQVKVKGETAKQFLTCTNINNRNITVESGTASKTVDFSQLLQNNVDYSSAHTIVTTTWTPSSLTVSKEDVGKFYYIKMNLLDEFGNENFCYYEYAVIATSCADWSLDAPENGKKVCDGPSKTCTISCDSGYIFVGQNFVNMTQIVYNCVNDVFEYQSSAQVPKCAVASKASHWSTFVYSYEASDKSTAVTGDPCTSGYKAYFESNAVGSFASTLQTACRASANINSAIEFPTREVELIGLATIVSVTLKLKYDPKLTLTSDDIKNCEQIIKSKMNDVLSQLTVPVADCPDILLLTAKTTVSSEYICDPGYFNYINVQECTPCPAGSSLVGSVCQSCAVGKYQDATGQTSCRGCPSGTTTNSTGAYDASLCKGTCPAGTTSSNGLPPCSPCAADMYSSSTTTCVSCPNNKTTHGVTGVDSVDKCNGECPAGSASYDGMAPCTKCPAGTYQALPGNTTCTQCPFSNQTTPTDGATSETVCTDVATSRCSGYCSNNGACVIENHMPKCICTNDYTGPICSKQVDPCDSNPCYYDGACVRVDYQNYTCTCKPVEKYSITTHNNKYVTGSFQVSNTTESSDACGKICLDNPLCKRAYYATTSKTCHQFYATGAFETGSNFIGLDKKKDLINVYSGDRCQDEVNNCTNGGDAYCQNGACRDDITGFQCLCYSGAEYAPGDTSCTPLTQICTSKPCNNNGTCISQGINRRYCQCAPGFTGENCQTDIDECASKPCLYGGNCTQGNDTFTCECPTNFSGDQCENRPPNLCSPDPCGGNGTCVEDYINNKPTCICNPGYGTIVWTFWINGDLNGGNENFPTLQKEHLDETTRYICDGKKPLDIQCRDKDTKKNWNETGDILSVNCTVDGGIVCLQADQVANNRCSNYEVRFQCYEDWHDNCDDIDECVSNPCHNGGECVNKENDFMCNCQPGYDGFLCQHDLDNCTGNPCVNGKCIDGFDSYTCVCEQGYTGANCEVNIDECQTMTNCSGVGNCTDAINGYMCNCEKGYTGQDCEIDIDECAPKPCMNNGTCMNVIGDFNCSCVPGWSGKQCEIVEKVCTNSTCQNNATCVDGFNDYFCKCPPGFFGRNCEKIKDLCRDANPCHNSSQCYLGSDGLPACNCSAGRIGKGCQCVVNQCEASPSPCINGACLILEDNKSYKCLCKPGFTGSKCETNIDSCKNLNVTCNGGSCIDLAAPDLFICKCPANFIGNNCELNVTDPKRQDSAYRFTGKSSTEKKKPMVLDFSSFTFGVWLRFIDYDTNAKKTQTIMSLCETNHETLKAEEKEILRITSEGLSANFNGFSASTGFVRDYTITGGSWYYLAAVYDAQQGKLRLHAMKTKTEIANYQTNNFTLPLLVSAILGQNCASTDSYFKGDLSLFNVWNKALTDADIENIIDAEDDFGKLIGYSFMSNLQVGWPGFIIAPGISRISNITICTENCPKQVQTILFPQAAKCPKTIQVLTVEADRNSVTWMPTQVPPNAKSNYQPGEQLYSGRYVMTYVYDTNGTCSSEVIVRKSPAEIPKAPSGVKQECAEKENGIKRCSFSCQADTQALLQTTANFRTLGYSGYWSVEGYSKSIDRVHDRCGDYTNTTKYVVIGYTYPRVGDGVTDFTTSVAKSLQGQLSYDFKEKIAKEYPDLCNGDSTCPNMTITVFKNRTVQIILPNVPLLVNGLPINEVLVDTILVQNKLKTLNYIGTERVPIDTFTVNSEMSVCEGINTQVLGNKCVQCTVGTMYNSTLKKCLFCEKGTYQDEPGKDSCKTCPQNNTITETYGAASISECYESCPAGQFYNISGANCEPCERGTYQDLPGYTYCMSCPKGKSTAGTGAFLKENCTDMCPSGQQISASFECEPCSVGMYRTSGESDLCIMCPTGVTTTSKGSSSKNNCTRVLCPAGKYRLGEDTCIPCAKDQYRTFTQENCTACPDMYYTAGNSSTTINDCQPECPAGRYAKKQTNDTHSAYVCEVCPKGTYKSGDPSKAGAVECDKCAKGKPYTLWTNSTSASECRTGPCPLGTTVNFAYDALANVLVEECLKCPEGFYQDVPDPLFEKCQKCPAMTFTRKAATHNASQCEAYCDDGEEINDEGKCVKCEIGWYKNNLAEPDKKFSRCQMCNVDLITEGVGSTHVDNCTIANCSAGSFRNKTNNCEACGYDTYQDEKWKETCKSCGAKATNITGASSISDCLEYCPSGKIYDSSNKCVDCERGFYKNNSESQLSKFQAACDMCDSSVITADKGAEGINMCVVGNCTAGSFISGSGCVTCPLGTYQGKKWMTTCEKCPDIIAGTITSTRNNGSTSVQSCIPSCKSGYQYDSATKSCVACLRGFYKDNTQNVDVQFKACEPCPDSAFITISTGSINVSACSVANCSAGYFRNSTNQCQECPLDTYNDQKWLNGQCNKCPSPLLSTKVLGAIDVKQCVWNRHVQRIFVYFKISKPYDPSKQGETKTKIVNAVKKYLIDKDASLAKRNLRVVVLILKRGSIDVTLEVKANTYNDENDIGDPAKTIDNLPGITASINEAVNTDNALGELPLVPGSNQVALVDQVEVGGATSVCENGNYLDVSKSKCEPCLKGEFQPAGTKDICEQCDEGFTTTTTGTNTDKNQACKRICPAGEESNDNINCVKCTKGYYKEKEGIDNCTRCLRLEETTPNDGALSQAECVSVCTTGQYSLNGSGCIDCPKGTYQDKPNQYYCNNCSKYFTTLSTKKTLSTDCISICQADQTLCNGHGTCIMSVSGAGPACVCDDPYFGDRCEIRGEPTGNSTFIMIVVLSIAGSILFIGILILGVYRCCIRDDASSKGKNSRTPSDIREEGSVISPPVGNPYPSGMLGNPILGPQPVMPYYDESRPAYRYYPSPYEMNPARNRNASPYDNQYPGGLQHGLYTGSSQRGGTSTIYNWKRN